MKKYTLIIILIALTGAYTTAQFPIKIPKISIPKAEQTRIDPLSFIKQESLFGDLAKNERFATLYTAMVQKIHKDANIKKYMQEML